MGEENYLQYFQSHSIQPICQILVAAVSYKQPVDHLTLFNQVLQGLKAIREGRDPINWPSNEDIVKIFGGESRFQKNYVTNEQVEKTLINFGIKKEVAIDFLDNNPGPFNPGECREFLLKGIATVF